MASTVSEGTPPCSSTIAELIENLRDLETRFLGGISDPSVSSTSTNPFQPVSGIRRRIETFRSSVGVSTSSDKKDVQAKLPSVSLPQVD